MVWLANIFANLFGSLAGIFGVQLAKRTLFAGAAISAALALTMAFTLAIEGLLGGIAYALPTMLQPAFYVLPSNLAPCLSAIVAAKIGKAIYEYHMNTLRLVASIS